MGEAREIGEAMRRRSSEIGHIRSAVVAAADGAFGDARMIMAQTDDVPVAFNVFRDLDSARDWLDIPVEYDLPFN